MKHPIVLIIISAMLLLFSCIEHHTEVIHVESTETVADPNIFEEPPPPPGFSCADSVALPELFIRLSNQAKNINADSAVSYHLFVTRIEKCMALRFLSDKELKDFKASAANSKANLKFPPMYALAGAAYQNMEWKPIFNKIRTELKALAQTPAFQNSRLAKAKSVTIQLNDLEEVVLK